MSAYNNCNKCNIQPRESDAVKRPKLDVYLCHIDVYCPSCYASISYDPSIHADKGPAGLWNKTFGEVL
jgi:hypothetical protein